MTTLAAAADEAVIVTTPEPTSVADAHAAINRFHRSAAPPRLRVAGQPGGVGLGGRRRIGPAGERRAGSSRRGRLALGPGHSSRPACPMAVRDRRPFLRAIRATVASAAFDALPAPRTPPPSRNRRPGFFAVLAARWALEPPCRRLAAGHEPEIPEPVRGDILQPGGRAPGSSRNHLIKQESGQLRSNFRVVVMVSLKPIERRVRYY